MALKRWYDRMLEAQRRQQQGTIVIKTVYCKSCKRCKGHGPYRYCVWRQEGKLKWKYLGKVEDDAQA